MPLDRISLEKVHALTVEALNSLQRAAKIKDAVQLLQRGKPADTAEFQTDELDALTRMGTEAAHIGRAAAVRLMPIAIALVNEGSLVTKWNVCPGYEYRDWWVRGLQNMAPLTFVRGEGGSQTLDLLLNELYRYLDGELLLTNSPEYGDFAESGESPAADSDNYDGREGCAGGAAPEWSDPMNKKQIAVRLNLETSHKLETFLRSQNIDIEKLNRQMFRVRLDQMDASTRRTWERKNAGEN